MNRQSQYYGYRFPPEIISYKVWLYHRFALSFRDIEDLLAERGIILSYETIRQWCLKFGPEYAGKLRKRQGRLSDSWFMDEAFVTINGVRHYLWRTVDQDGDVIDTLVQKRRDKRAAKRFFRKLMQGQGCSQRRIVTDRLRSYGAARKEVMPSVTHCQDRSANNLAEVSRQHTHEHEGQMQRVKSPGHVQQDTHFAKGVPGCLRTI